VEELLPRGLPLGVPGSKEYQEGKIEMGKGDILVLYSDGLTDARPELALNNAILAERLKGAASAHEMVDSLVGLTQQQGPQPDDITVLVVNCTG
jgi:serine phosphatase RsbU (regulator of sigma subunit)